MILGIDGGIATLGYSIVRPKTGRVLELGVWTSAPDKAFPEWTDRVRRISAQARFLGDLIEKWEITTIAAEGISVGGAPPARFSMGTSLCLCWGVLAGLSEGMDCDLFEVPPKQWQHAILPDVDKIDYDELFAKLSVFVGDQAGRSLSAIKETLRTHALDSVGVGVYASMLIGTEISVARRGLRA